MHGLIERLDLKSARQYRLDQYLENLKREPLKEDSDGPDLRSFQNPQLFENLEGGQNTHLFLNGDWSRFFLVKIQF